MTLPNFLIVGAPKAGTTSLARWIGRHPEIAMSSVKDGHYFTYVDRPPPPGPGDERFSRLTSLARYEETFVGAGAAACVGECSVSYLADPHACASVSAALPDVRVIALLRDPVARAVSQYQHNLRDGFETLDPVAALAAESERRRAGWHVSWWYREAGRYDVHLRRWFEAVGADRVLPVLFEDLVADPAGTVARCAAHLGVDPQVVVDVSEQANPGGVPRSALLHRLVTRPPAVVSALGGRLLPATVRGRLASSVHIANLRKVPALEQQFAAVLRTDFIDSVEATAALVGRDLSGWLTSGIEGTRES